MKVIAVIPARYAASRFPGKLMKMLGDKTVIRTTYENVVKTQLFEDVFVVTDSEIIFREITEHKGKAIMSLKEHETGSDRIAEAIINIDCDIVLNVQGDEPFMEKEPLEKLLKSFEGKIGEEISLSTLKQQITVEEDIQNPNNVKVIVDNNDFALYFSRYPLPYAREQHFTAKYFKHIGVYAFRKQALLEFSKLPMLQNEKAEKIECIRYLEYGMKIKVITTDFVGIGIDTAEDLVKANEIIKNKIC